MCLQTRDLTLKLRMDDSVVAWTDGACVCNQDARFRRADGQWLCTHSSACPSNRLGVLGGKFHTARCTGGRSTRSCLRKLISIHGQRKLRGLLVPSHRLWKARGPIVHQGNPEAFRSRSSAELLLAEHPRTQKCTTYAGRNVHAIFGGTCCETTCGPHCT